MLKNAELMNLEEARTEIMRLELQLAESRAREARLSATVSGMRSTIGLVRDWMADECSNLDLHIAALESIGSWMCTADVEVAPLRWLEAQRKRAAADELERRGKEFKEATGPASQRGSLCWATTPYEKGMTSTYLANARLLEERATKLRVEADALERGEVAGG